MISFLFQQYQKTAPELIELCDLLMRQATPEQWNRLFAWMEKQNGVGFHDDVQNAFIVTFLEQQCVFDETIPGTEEELWHLAENAEIRFRVTIHEWRMNTIACRLERVVTDVTLPESSIEGVDATMPQAVEGYSVAIEGLEPQQTQTLNQWKEWVQTGR